MRVDADRRVGLKAHDDRMALRLDSRPQGDRFGRQHAVGPRPRTASISQKAAQEALTGRGTGDGDANESNWRDKLMEMFAVDPQLGASRRLPVA